MLPRFRSPPDDDRDKADAKSSSGPSAADPVWSADSVRSRPGIELEKVLETVFLSFFSFASFFPIALSL